MNAELESVEFTEEDFDRQSALADRLLDNLIKELDESDENRACVLYDVWLKITHHLANLGWTAAELAHDAVYHACDQIEYNNTHQNDDETIQ